MARTIRFLDGTVDVLLTEEIDAELERIIREKLGDDTVELLKECAEVNVALEDELKSYEASCEDYRNLLEDVRDHLRSIYKLTQKLNCSKVNLSIQSLITAINNHL